ncbi:hypothetical protein TSUD_359860 [Trifolium subterraneum]|uniref:Uncharacterized protein n=1 Tax=Trifolium subterraneum TaxID=3900 RepID=A0A2Z6MM55_TRISU|nr:hypothetical protein TSUD_359860 [Trifolium subterraneum]
MLVKFLCTSTILNVLKLECGSPAAISCSGRRSSVFLQLSTISSNISCWINLTVERDMALTITFVLTTDVLVIGSCRDILTIEMNPLQLTLRCSRLLSLNLKICSRLHCKVGCRESKSNPNLYNSIKLKW